VMSGEEWADDALMLDRAVALLSAEGAQARADAALKARAVRHATPQAMAEATLANYARALPMAPRDASIGAAFDNARVRDALGYRPWTPPAIAEPVVQMPVTPSPATASGSMWQRLALRALAMRRTPMGRLLYRMTPAPVIDALKSRLHD
jgi:hypothetical protein